MRRTWIINGRFLTQPATGVQRYGLEVVRALDRHLAHGHPLARHLGVELVAPEGTNPPPGLSAIAFRTAGHARGHVWEQAVLGRLARSGGLLSLCNTGPLTHRKHVVCIHDANTRTCPQSYSLAFRTLYRVLHPALGRTAASIATVSRYSARRLAAGGGAGGGSVVGSDHARHPRPRFMWTVPVSAASPQCKVSQSLGLGASGHGATQRASNLTPTSPPAPTFRSSVLVGPRLRIATPLVASLERKLPAA